MGVIYSITFVGADRQYIGSARSYRSRLNAHRHLLAHGKHHSILLQRAANKYGLDNLVTSILETVEDERLLVEREQAWLDSFKGRLYNRAVNASSRLGLTMSAEARGKISASLSGNQYRAGIPHDAESKAKIGEGVRAAYAEGRRRRVSFPENLAAHNAAVARGEKPHPSRNVERDIAIAASHALTRSPRKTGLEFGITDSAVLYAVRRTNPSQLRKWTRKCDTQ